MTRVWWVMTDSLFFLLVLLSVVAQVREINLADLTATMTMTAAVVIKITGNRDGDDVGNGNRDRKREW